MNSCNKSFIQERTNKEYLDKNTTEKNVSDDEESLKENIIKILEKNSHTYRTKEAEENYIKENIYEVKKIKRNSPKRYAYIIKRNSVKNNQLPSENYSQISELSINQNKIIYLMLTSLKDPSFVNEIGRIIKKDIENKYTEFGGIVEFKENGKINLRWLESELIGLKDKKNDGRYLIPKNENLLPKIAYFHLHADTYNETLFAGPSNVDILILEDTSLATGMANEFIITSLKKGKFNIDYTGVDIEKGKKAKIIDLGNYNYDTSKIR